MCHVIGRWLMRTAFVACAAWAIAALARVPANSAPTLHRQMDVPLAWAATSTVPAVIADTAAEGLAPVTEPPPEPEPEPREPGDVFGLMYHDLTLDESKTTVWTATPDSIRSDIEELMRYGYQPLSIEEYIDGNYEIGPDYFIVTFDDGYVSNLTLAEPLLRELGVPATVFVITGSTDVEGHMSWEELARLKEGGVFTIYSHTHTHMYAEKNTKAAFLADVAKAWEEITTHLGEPEYQILSYPGGAYTRESMIALAAEGYQLFTIQNWPWWYTEENAAGIRLLIRMNVSHDADIPGLLAFNRKNNGQIPLEEKLQIEAEKAAAAEAARVAELHWWKTKSQ